MSSKNKSSSSFQRSFNDSSTLLRGPKYSNEKYQKKSDSKSNKTKAKKKRQYKEIKPPKAVNHLQKTSREEQSTNFVTSMTHTIPLATSDQQSFRTPEKVDQKAKGNTEEINPTFLLMKNLGPNVDESTVRELIGDQIVINSLKIVKNSNNVYLKFEDPREIHRLIKDHEKNPLVFRNKKVKMCLVNKLPLDLNQKSKICKKIYFKKHFLFKFIF